MAHHKRGKRKDARSGCLMCKAHKSCGCKGTADRDHPNPRVRQDYDDRRHHRYEKEAP
jgi:hypothetical protein